MSKDYEAIFKERMAKRKEAVLGSAIMDELEIKNINNKRIDEIREQMKTVIGKEIWNDFLWKTGKIFGILRCIAQNPQYKEELYRITNLNETYVNMYIEVCGNLPFISTRDGSVNMGRPMNVEKTREFIPLVAMKMGILIEDDDLSDITQERWDYLYNAALERIEKSSNFNKEIENEVKYDE